MKTIETLWLSGITGTIAIVVGEDKITKERKAYAGKVNGYDENSDIEMIKTKGAPLEINDVKSLLKLMQNEED